MGNHVEMQNSKKGPLRRRCNATQYSTTAAAATAAHVQIHLQVLLQLLACGYPNSIAKSVQANF